MCFWSHKFGKVEADGFQYCVKCNFARKPDPPSCNHNWETIHKTDVFRRFHDMPPKVIGYLYVSRCKICGDISEKHIDL